MRGWIAQTLLGASVILIVVRSLFLCSVTFVPASQVFSHQGLLDVLVDLFVASGHWTLPGWPYRGVHVL